MSPTSYQLLYPAIFCSVVPVTGLEPVQYRYRGILSPLCLPIPPHRQLSAMIRIPYSPVIVKHGQGKPFKFFRQLPLQKVQTGARFRAIFRPEAHILAENPNAKEDNRLYTRELTAERVNWLSVPEPDRPLSVTAKTRYSQREAAATVEPLPGGRIRMVFTEPQRAVTPGQAVVFYDGDLVLGGGTICP